MISRFMCFWQQTGQSCVQRKENFCYFFFFFLYANEMKVSEKIINVLQSSYF